MNNRTTKALSRAKKNMPFGVSDNYRYWGEKDTIFIDKMSGCHLYDLEGSEYVDFRLAYGPIILGYRDNRVDSAVIDCITTRGSMCGLSTELESDVVERIKSMCPSIEKLRFANSGTEAVLASIRTTRGYTGRENVVVVEGVTFRVLAVPKSGLKFEDH